ncbi:MAG: hypothetical protein KDD82_18560, partial [Planctomycetes bacterium]|nr:hypothetical protein [Planctomycetota bacterium]
TGAQDAAAQAAASVQAALAGLPVSADSLQRLLGGSGSPLSTAGRALFVVGFLVFGTCTFLQNWTRTKASSLRAYAEKVENLEWGFPKKEPDDPRYPPNPASTDNNWAYWVKKDNGDYGVDVPASAIKEHEDLSKEVKERIEEWKRNERKDYYQQRMDWWSDHYEDWHDEVNAARQARQDSERLTNEAVMGVFGYFVRWFGIGCMFLGMTLLALKGERNEQLVALIVIGIGLLRLVT